MLPEGKPMVATRTLNQPAVRQFWLLLMLVAAIPVLIAPTPEQGSALVVARLAGDEGGGMVNTEWVATYAVLDAQPRWDAFTTVPLSPERASQLALTSIRASHTNVNEWVIDEINLNDLSISTKKQVGERYTNVWAYQVTAVPKDAAVRRSLEKRVALGRLTRLILLDGSIVSSATSPFKQGQDGIYFRSLSKPATNGN